MTVTFHVHISVFISVYTYLATTVASCLHFHFHHYSFNPCYGQLVTVVRPFTPVNRAEAPISIIACPHRDRVIINIESYSVTFLTDQSACSLQHRESWFSAVWGSLSVVAECPVHIVVFIS